MSTKKNKPQVDLRPLLDRAMSGPMPAEDARAVAVSILDLCEDVDPSEEESEWERYAAQQAREMAAEAQAEVAPTVVVGIDPSALTKAIHASLGSRGLAVRKPSPHHIQIMQGRQVFAEWWPSKGTTRAGGQAGPKCRDEVRLIAWLRSLV